MSVDPPTFMFFNVRGLGISKVTPSGNQKLDYIFEVSPKINCVICIVEVWFNWGSLPTLGLNVPAPYRLAHLNSDGKGSGIMILLTPDIVKNESVVLSKGRLSFLKLSYNNNFNFNLYCTYMPQSNQQQIDVLASMKSHINSTNSHSEPTMISGDWNFDSTRYYEDSQKQIVLDNILKIFTPNLIDASAHYGDDIPTWVGPGKRGLHSFSRIDRLYCNFFSEFKNFCTTMNPTSDHRFLMLSSKKKNDTFNEKWSNTLFDDVNFEKEALHLCIKVMIENADIDLSTVSPDDYLSPSFANNMSFSPSGEQDLIYIPIYSLLMSKLLSLNAKKARETSQRLRNELREFETQYDRIFHKHLKSPSLDSAKTLDDIKRESKDFLSTFFQNKRRNRHIQNMYSDGKSNAYTYKRFKARCKNPTHLSINDVIVKDENVLIGHFEANHKKITSEQPQIRDDFPQLVDNFEKFFGINFDSLFNCNFEVSPIITTRELKKALDSMSAISAKGPSGQGKQIFLFFMKFFPSFFTSLVNEIVRKDISRTSLAYIKSRKIIFIPKKGAQSIHVNDYRPISLLEFIYKMISKTLVNKVEQHLPEIVQQNQFGFIKGRRMATATLSAMGMIHEVRRAGEGLVMFLDIAKAFDSIRHDLMSKTIADIFINPTPDESFANLWLRWTNHGQAHVAVGKLISENFNLTVGVGQGDSSSSAKYVILHALFTKIFESPKLSHLLFTLENGKKMLPLTFADDTVLMLKIKSEEDITLLHEAFQQIGKLTGLYINPLKTAILSPKDAYVPENIALIGRIKTHAKHLGMALSMDSDLAYKITYTEAIKKMEKKSNSIFFRFKDNLLKRKHVISTMIVSCMYHIYPIYMPRPPEIKKIKRIIQKALWGLNSTHRFRAKIAAERLEFPLRAGGLGLWNPSRRATTSFLSAFTNAVAFINYNDQSNLSKICANHGISMYKFMLSLGSYSLQETPAFFSIFYPSSTVKNLFKAREMLLKIEKHPWFFYRSSLQYSVYASTGMARLFRLTKEECAYLAHEGVVSVGDLLDRTPTGNGHFMFKSTLNPRLLDNNIDLSPRIIDIAKNIVSNVSKIMPVNRMQIFGDKPFRLPIKPIFYHATFSDKAFFSKVSRRLLFDETNNLYPPALNTRIRDNVETYDPQIIMESFEKLLRAKIPLKLKSFHVEFIYRTLPSRSKLFSFGIAQSYLCGRCVEKADTEHILYYCSFPKFCMKKIAAFLDDTYHKGVPNVHLCRMKWFLYNIYVEEIPKSVQNEIMNLSLLLKQFCIMSAAEDKWRTWTVTVHFAQLMSHVKRTILQRKYLNIPVDTLQALHNYLVNDYTISHAQNV